MEYIRAHKNIILLVFTIILIILLICAMQYIKFSNQFLSGLWVCDDIFCTKSEINQLLFFVGDGNFYNKKACLLILDTNNTPYQFMFDIKCNPITNKIFLSGDDGDNIFPKKMNMDLSFINGTLILSDNEQDYAHLYKDNINNI